MSVAQFVKCVIVGDGYAGKTCLVKTYTSNTFPPNDGCFAIHDNYSATVTVDGRIVNLDMWITAGQEEYNRLRPLCYRDADVFVLAFSLVNKNSYNDVWKRWLPELKHHAPSVPIILVGTKQDLREDVNFLKLYPQYAPVSTAENLNAVFEEAVKAVKTDRFINCVTVGDGAVGKTCLLESFTSNTFPTDGVPTVKDNFIKVMIFKENQLKLGLWDTAGQADHDLRTLSYRGADVFVLAFSLVTQNSYESVYKKWLPELKHHAPMVPIILVGTKQDLREDVDFLKENPQYSPISTAQVDELKRMVGFGVSAYIECSAKLQQNVTAVFEEAAKAVLQQRKKKGKGLRVCSIM